MGCVWFCVFNFFFVLFLVETAVQRSLYGIIYLYCQFMSPGNDRLSLEKPLYQMFNTVGQWVARNLNKQTIRHHKIYIEFACTMYT